MAAEQPWSVRAALAVVGAVDRVGAIVLGTFAALEKPDDAKRPAPLAAFRRIASVGAKGAKWSFIAAITVSGLAMFAVAVLAPKVRPAPSQPMAPLVENGRCAGSSDAAVIARNCRTGRCRPFPEIKKTECAARAAPFPAQRQGDAK